MDREALTLAIDGREVTVPDGTTLLQAAARLGIRIPVLCHDAALRPAGVCRVCAVEVEGTRALQASCARPAEAGMKVHTASPRALRARRVLVELLMADHPSPCARQARDGDCALENLAAELGVRPGRYRATGAARPRDLSSPVIAVDHAACILCDRCIRACDEVQCSDVIGRTGKGGATRIGFDLDQPMGASSCVACGECAAACPTGALTHRPLTLDAPMAGTRPVDSLCPYCGVGCAVTYHVRDNTIVRVSGRPSPVNQGRLCVKGRYGFDYAQHHQRLTVPLIRTAYPKGPLSRETRPAGAGDGPGGLLDERQVLSAFREATWEEALDLVASRLRGIRERSGPSALAGFGSAKGSNEEAYLFQKLVRTAFGSNNVDHCTRLCHASSVAALQETLGSGAVSNPFSDVQFAEVALVIGCNPTENHPVAATFIRQAVRAGTRLIVVNPRRPALADQAELYLRPESGTDVALLNGMMHVIIAEGLTDPDFIARRTEDFEAVRAVAAAYPPETAARICGVPAEQIRAAARTYAGSRRSMIFWGMGVSQHTTGTDNVRCLVSLCLMTGNVGRPGTGLHPLRGQNNVQGASDSGLIPMMFTDYQRVDDPEARARFQEAWGVELDPRPGATVVEIMHEAARGGIRGMYILGENPFLSDPNVNLVRTALSSLEFLVVQDIFPTETAEFADVILPAAAFAEKDGTYTNTDRRVQLGRKVLDPPGQARPDWRIICEISGRMGHPMDYAGPEQVFRELARLSPSLAGLDWARLGPESEVWPCPEAGAPGQPVLFRDRFPRGRGRFVPAEFAPARELPDAEYPFVLNTGRILQHWHTGTMTRRARALATLEPDPFVEVHPGDLARLGLADGQRVRVTSRRGTIVLAVRAGTRTSEGSIFIPFHFREAAANLLTNDALDPFGKIPEYKVCAVKVEAAAAIP